MQMLSGPCVQRPTMSKEEGQSQTTLVNGKALRPSYGACISAALHIGMQACTHHLQSNDDDAVADSEANGIC